MWNDRTKAVFENSMMHFLKMAAIFKSFLYETEFETTVKQIEFISSF